MSIDADTDPITVEVVRNYLQSSARQMRNTLLRASFNPVIYEMVDFSLGIFTRDAELIAEGPGIPFFMGSLSFTIRHVVNYVGTDKLQDGDVLLSTYPYWVGSHSQDAVVIRPIFFDGRIIAYTASKAHWIDIGAKDIYGTDTTDIWQEGLQLYGVKICKAGRLDRELVEIVRANSRLPDSVVGDLNAQIACCNLGAARVIELVQKYGLSRIEASVKSILDHGEMITRQAIAQIPDGEWTAEAAMDSNGITDDPVPLRIRVSKKGDEITVDTTGSAAQQVGPVNCPIASTISGVRLVMKMLTTPHYDANEGCFRPIKVVAPEGSVLNPRPPAPVFLYGWSAMIACEQIFRAMAEAIPERVVARSGGDLCGVMFSGNDPEDGSYFAGGSDESVGQGASFDADGESALIMYSLGESRNIPAEIVEERHPVLVQRYSLRRDSGGPGCFRGGLGVEKHWKALADLSLITVLEQSKYPAWGLFGGGSALANVQTFYAGTPDEVHLAKVSGFKLRRGGEWRVDTGGGGGWGNPLERDPAAVLRDVIGDYVSLEKARDDYGVVVERHDDDYVIDGAATVALRARLSNRSA